MEKKTVDFRKVVIVGIGFLIGLTLFTVVINMGIGLTLGQETATGSAKDPVIVKWGLIAAALAVGIGSIGAGIAVSSVGAAAMGSLAERPELAARALIFVGLAEGIAIYGLIIAIMILGKV